MDPSGEDQRDVEPGGVTRPAADSIAAEPGAAAGGTGSAVGDDITRILAPIKEQYVHASLRLLQCWILMAAVRACLPVCVPVCLTELMMVQTASPQCPGQCHGHPGGRDWGATASISDR